MIFEADSPHPSPTSVFTGFDYLRALEKPSLRRTVSVYIDHTLKEGPSLLLAYRLKRRLKIRPSRVASPFHILHRQNFTNHLNQDTSLKPFQNGGI
jgi:hypothetical protein